MSRRNDRKHAFILIFQIPFYETEETKTMPSRYFKGLELESEPDGGGSIDKAFIESEFFGVLGHLTAIDELINSAASGWDILRLNKVDLAILRLASYEIMFESAIPYRVSINEAVELAKQFSSDEAPSFVNGVLGKIAQTKNGTENN